MTRRIASILIVALLCVVLSACSLPSASFLPRRQRALLVSGSATSMPLVEALARHYPDRDVRFTCLPGQYSSSGAKGVAAGLIDVGALSRAPRAEETSTGVRYAHVADDAIAVATHPGVGVSALTAEQLRGIYAGQYESWAQLGGADVPIVVLDRPASDSARLAVHDRVLGHTQVSRRAIALTFDQDILQGLERTPGAIGYLSYGYIRLMGADVGIVSLDGVVPSSASVKDGSYRLVRPIGVMIGPRASSAAKEFVDWATGPEAARIMEEKGFAAARAATGG